MNTGNRIAAFNFEQRLADLNLSPAQRTQALDAMRAAEDMVAFVVVMGDVEFIGPGGEVLGVANAQTQRAEYARWCQEHGEAMRDLREG